MIHARLAELRRDWSALRAACERAVRRVEFGTDEALWIPSIPLAPPMNEPAPRSVPEPPAGEWTPHRLAGLDEHGRAVLVRSARGIEDEPPAAVLTFPSEEAEDDGKWVLHHALLAWDGPRLEIVRFLTHDEISELTWVDHDEAGRPVTFMVTSDSGVSVTTCEWEGDRCVAVRQDSEERTGEYDAEGLLRVHASERVVWDRTVHAYDPHPREPEAAIAAWVAAVADAAHRATADWPDAVAVKVMPHFERDHAPEVQVVERAYFERATKKVSPGDAISRCRQPAVPLEPLIGEAGRKAWRSLRQQQVEEWTIREALQRALDEAAWPAGVMPLAFGIYPEPEQERPAPAVTAPPADRAELEALLTRFNLPLSLADQAQWGVALLPGGTGRSRLGGRPDLARWPYFEGRPLTHLASIRFEELPAVPGRELLPATGTLVVCAALTEEDALWEPTPCGDPRVRFLHLPPGEEAGPAEPPTEWEPLLYDTPPLLQERLVRFEPVLTLPQHPTGLQPEDEILYEPLWWALTEVTPGLTEPAHLLLGHPQVVQWDPREPGELSVLHLGWDEELGFQFLDGGDLTFHGAPEDVRAGRWERLTVTPNSG